MNSATFRIYDAAFELHAPKSHHSQLATFWWIDTSGKKGEWTRRQAVGYALSHRGDICVGEGENVKQVRAFHNDRGEEWIQTFDANGKQHDLMELARHHT